MNKQFKRKKRLLAKELTRDDFSYAIDVDREVSEHFCKDWMGWRNTYLQPRPPKHSSRLPIDIEGQAGDLKRSLACAEYLSESIQDGNTFLLGHLASELRALIYFPDPNNKGVLNQAYNPLLLRLAQRLNLPLPVWAVKNTRKTFPKPDQLRVTTSTPTMKPIENTARLVDIQEWLLFPIALVHETGGDKTLVTNREFILQLAASMGSAH